MARIVHGSGLAEQGQANEGIAEIRQGMADWQAMGQELEWPQFLGLLAEAYGKVDRVAEGLKVLADAMAVAEKTGERFWMAELHRQYGELSLRIADESTGRRDAEQSFQKAIEIARGQSAKSLELRAAMSLYRLGQRQGNTDEARQILAEIYGWFTEGFGTGDLQEARALLQEHP